MASHLSPIVRSAARGVAVGGVDPLGLGEQRLLGFGVGRELGVALGGGGIAGREELVLGALEPLPQRVVDVLGRPAGGLPLGQQVAERRRGGSPVGGVTELLGAHTQSFLGLPGAGPFAVQFGEVRTAASVERLARRRVPLPQRVVGLAVDAADRLPLVEDGAHPVTGGLPLRRRGGQLLGLDGERLLASRLLGAELLALGLLLLRGAVGLRDDRGQPLGQRIDIAEHVRLGQALGQGHRRGADLARVAGT